MDAKTDSRSNEREAVAVNRNLTIEISLDEILEDLFFPGVAK